MPDKNLPKNSQSAVVGSSISADAAVVSQEAILLGENMGEAQGPKKQERTLEQIQQELKRIGGELGWSRLARLYFVPLTTLLVFIGILIFLIFPALGGVFAQLDQMNLVLAQVDALEEQLAAAGQLAKDPNLTDDLEYVNSTVPTGTSAVAEFQQRITGIAKSNGLTVSEVTTAEQVIDIEEGQLGSASLVTVQIPSNYKISGDLPSMQAFIAEIKSTEDFVIIGEMDLRNSQAITREVLSGIAELEWGMQLTLVKYQFQALERDGSKIEDVYLQIPLTAQADAEVLGFIRDKYE